jgi:cupin 2 domain-containing protein
MNSVKGNIFLVPKEDEKISEIFETIAKSDDICIERIITTKNFIPPGDWYDQDEAEWVILIQGEAKLKFESGEIVSLLKGDFIIIPAHKKHRVEMASNDPGCIWLAVHGNLK